MQNVTLPDGGTASFPDDMPPEQIAAILQGHAKAQAPVPKVENPALGALHSAGTGLVKGVIASTVGLPGNLSELGRAGLSAAGFAPSTKESFLPTSRSIEGAIDERFPGLLRKPETEAEKYIQGGTEGVGAFVNPFGLGGAILGRGAKAAPILTKGGAAAGGALGLANEAGRTAFSSNPEAGGLLAQSPLLAALAYATLRKPQTVQAAQDYLRDIGPEGLIRAEQTRRKATATTGLPTLLSQGTESSTALDGIVDALVQSKQGAGVRATLDKQQQALPGMVEGFNAGMSSRGATSVEQNATAAAGKGIFDDARDIRARMTAPHYQAADSDMVDPKPIVAAILKARQDLNIPQAVPEGKRMATLQAMIASAGGQPLRVLELDTVARQARAAAQKAWDRGNPTKYQAENAIADAIDNATRQASPALAAGKDTHKTVSEALIDPLTKGPAGSMFPKQMQKSGVGDMDSWVSQLDGMSANDIVTLGARLRQQDPQALPSIIRESFQRKAEAALSKSEGRVGDAGFTSFPNAVRGNTQAERDAFGAKIAQVALSHGVDPALASKGANEFLDALEVMGRSRSNRGVASEFSQDAGGSAVTRLMRSASLTAPLRGVGYAIDRATHKAVFEKMADAMTSPDGVKMLLDIAKYGAMSARGQTLVRALAGETAMNAGAEDPVPRDLPLFGKN